MSVYSANVSSALKASTGKCTAGVAPVATARQAASRNVRMMSKKVLRVGGRHLATRAFEDGSWKREAKKPFFLLARLERAATKKKG